VLPGFEASQWYALVAPKNAPGHRRDHRAVAYATKMKTRIAELGGEPMPMTPPARQARRR
jgi:hypothetical protein